MLRLFIFSLTLGGGVIAPLFGQGGLRGNGSNGDEEVFLASTKQVNQFFRRFNGEEDPSGNKYLISDKKFRSFKIRKAYLPLLIDPAVAKGQESLIDDFYETVNDKKQPYYLDNHKDDWTAEVNCSFSYKGQQEDVALLMKLQPQGQGYEWVIEDVDAGFISSRFEKDNSESKPFIHPMSHELDFMNLNKAFRKANNPESYTLDNFRPDPLSVFLYEMKMGELKFNSVRSVRFHFFSTPGWYFEISEYNRPGLPSGWLISNLVRATDDQKDQIRDYVYGR
ncbi:MAG: hypothetical protein ACO2ZZ_08155 [Cyclobacteriaceae bacterium]